MSSGSFPSSPPTDTNMSYLARARERHDVKMTFQEKMQLSCDVNNLPADDMERIVDMAMKSEASAVETNEDNDEFELDLDSISNQTLREMQAYAEQVLSELGGRESNVSDDDIETSLKSNDAPPVSKSQVEEDILKAPQKVSKMPDDNNKRLTRSERQRRKKRKYGEDNDGEYNNGK